MELLKAILTVTFLILVVIMIFNVIIFVHELGHFFAAKWRGLVIDRFQIWFGKPIWKKEINGVQYGMGWIPAGGFVALPQMAPMEALEGTNDRDEPIPPIKPLDKIIVAFAGPLFSMLLALACAVLVWVFGKPADFIASTEVGYIAKGSPAEMAGLHVGDTIVSINDNEVDGFLGSLDSVTEQIILSEGKQITFGVKRPGVDGVLKLDSGWETPDTRWFQRSGLRQVGIEPASESLVGEVIPGSPADEAGMQPDDLITHVDGFLLHSPGQLSQHMEDKDWGEVELTVKRGEKSLKLKITPVRPAEPAGRDPMLGVRWAAGSEVDTTIVRPGPGKQVLDSLRMMYVTIVKVISPDSSIGVDHLSGPIGIARAKFQLLQMEDGWRRVLAFMVLFNVNLAVLNMMPFPVLDGGHITLASLEALFRRPVKARFLEVLQMGFAIALICLMLYVTSKDIGDEFGHNEGPTEIKF